MWVGKSEGYNGRCGVFGLMVIIILKFEGASEGVWEIAVGVMDLVEGYSVLWGFGGGKSEERF